MVFHGDFSSGRNMTFDLFAEIVYALANSEYSIRVRCPIGNRNLAALNELLAPFFNVDEIDVGKRRIRIIERDENAAAIAWHEVNDIVPKLRLVLPPLVHSAIV